MITRSVPLVRSGPIRRKTRLRPQSAKRRRGAGKRKACIQAVRLRSGGWCEMRIKGVCVGKATDVHEVLSRARGGNPHDPANCLDACRMCHRHAHENPRAAAELGLLVAVNKAVT